MKRVVGVEDCSEEAEGESTDAERHVKAGVPETLEHLSTDQKIYIFISGLKSREYCDHEHSLTPPLLSGSVLCP